MGLPTHRTQNSIRFSLGAGNTDADIDRLLEKLPRAVEKLRSLTERVVSTPRVPRLPKWQVAKYPDRRNCLLLEVLPNFGTFGILGNA